MGNLRLGIIGIGSIGMHHAKRIASGTISRLTLTAVCDIDCNRLTQALKELPTVAQFAKAEDLIHSGLVDAVLIATPHYEHPKIAVKAFAAGLHVLTEKPAGVTVGEVARMNKAAEKAGTVFGIMWNQRTHPLFQKAKELIDSGRLGELKRMVWIITNWYRTQAYYDSATWRATWSGEGGGVLMNQAPHNLDLWQWLIGMPKRIYATCDIGKWHDIEVEDDATILGYYPNGATAIFITSTGEFPGTNRLEISGSKGKIVLEKNTLTFTELPHDEREICQTCTDGAPMLTCQTEELVCEKTLNGHDAILQNFTEAVLDGTPLLAPGKEGIQEITLSNAAYLSAWLGREITLPLNCDEFEKQLSKRVNSSRGTRNKNVNALSPQPDRWRVNW